MLLVSEEWHADMADGGQGMGDGVERGLTNPPWRKGWGRFVCTFCHRRKKEELRSCVKDYGRLGRCFWMMLFRPLATAKLCRYKP